MRQAVAGTLMVLAFAALGVGAISGDGTSASGAAYQYKTTTTVVTTTTAVTTNASPPPDACPLDGEGTIRGTHRRRARLDVDAFRDGSGAVIYHDPGAHVHFSSRGSLNVVCDGPRVAITGRGVVGESRTRFTVTATDRGPGTSDSFSITLTHGSYSRSGRLRSGDLHPTQLPADKCPLDGEGTVGGERRRHARFDVDAFRDGSGAISYVDPGARLSFRSRGTLTVKCHDNRGEISGHGRANGKRTGFDISLADNGRAGLDRFAITLTHPDYSRDGHLRSGDIHRNDGHGS